MPKGDEEVQPTDDWLTLPAEQRDLEAYAKKYGEKDIQDCAYLGFESAIPQIQEQHLGDMRKIHDLNVLAKMYMEMPPEKTSLYFSFPATAMIREDSLRMMIS